MGKKTIEVDIRVPNQTRYLGLIAGIGKELARELEKGPEGTLAHQLSAVLTEAMTNVIRHAHADDPNKTVQISISISDDELCIKVYDYGRGFDLESLSEGVPEEMKEHGRGIFIIRCFMDTVSYRKQREYNVLEMWKKLK